MYAKNIVNLFQTLYPKGATAPAFDDEVTSGCCLTHDGAIQNEAVRSLFAKKGTKEAKKK